MMQMSGKFSYRIFRLYFWKDKTIFIDDNLPIMRGMNGGSVDLIYIILRFLPN